MPKTFYTERDIEDLAKRGVLSLVDDDDVVLTDIARDKAIRLGIELLRDHDKPPSAPERPYITKIVSPSASSPGQAISNQTGPTIAPPISSSTVSSDDLHKQVRAAVVARLGDSVDQKLLDTIISRVLQNVGNK
ncbi:MAG: hypothetical protein WBD56_01365 [Anaerolineales bacterium]